jgi:hypothetical protein
VASIPGLVNQLVEAPTPGRLRYGLFNVATSQSLDMRGIAAGTSFLVDHCGGASAYDTNGCDPNPEKPFVEGSDLIEAEPFWVVAKKHCGTVGRDASEMETAVRTQLLAGEQTVVESVLWNGAGLAAHAPTLEGSGATITTPTAAGAGAAIAHLESVAYGAAFGYEGVIHVNQRAYAALAYSGLLVRDGNVWRTQLGTALSFGAGYAITGPAGIAPADGFVWAFMTAPVTLRRSEVMVPDVTQTLDRTANQWNATAERVYTVTYECPEVFAVQVPVAAPAVATAPAVPA